MKLTTKKFRSGKSRFFLIVPIMAALALFAASCGSDSDDDGDSVGVGLVYDIGGRGDQSFNDSAFAGLDRAQQELGIQGSESSPEDDGSNRAALLELQAQQSDLVFGVGFLFAGPILATAAQFPDTNFAIVDDQLGNDGAGPPSNAVGLVFAEDEGSCLVGVAAALKTETRRVGFIGGVRIPLIEKFERGYTTCIEDVDSSIEVDIVYISEPPDFGGFNDPARARVIAERMFDEGADIVYHAAGGSGGGMFEAAQEYSTTDGNSKVWGIGVDSDQYNTVGATLREYVLTSMLKRVDVAVFGAIQDQVNGNFPGGTVQTFDLAVDGVGYSTTGGFVDDIVSQLEDYRQRVIDGEFDFS